MQNKVIKLNTSNKDKIKEFEKLFAKHNINIETSFIDLKEIDAEPLMVVAQKASQVEEGVLVEDTSLYVEEASVGVNVKWVLEHISNYIGKKAVWTVYLARRSGESILIFKGEVPGMLVPEKKGKDGFGFDHFFMPTGSDKTLSEFKPDKYNARAMAVEALINHDVFTRYPVILDWNGPWQGE